MSGYIPKIRPGFEIYDDHIEALRKTTAEGFKDLFMTLHDYSMALKNGVEFTLPELADARADTMLPVMAAAIMRAHQNYEKGREVRRQSRNAAYHNHLSQPLTDGNKPSQAVTGSDGLSQAVTDGDEGKETKGKETKGKEKIYIYTREDDNTTDDSEEIKAIVEYLNQKAGTAYRATTEKTRMHIMARLNEGFTVDDFRTVIDKKCQDWIGTEYEQWLRPETLFGTKFEGYLNAKKGIEGNGEPEGTSCEAWDTGIYF